MPCTCEKQILKMMLKRTDHHQHVSCRRLNRSPEGIVHIYDLGLHGCVLWANICADTEEHAHTLKRMRKQQIKDAMSTDIYSGSLRYD
ncbi:hypothetical protein GOODEAATRI_023388 [Goodea atripinnis]|uniref:Uncharacterized protein n=1 Tax=Goodea atripinnis TaxID=208336 RepID=A0ABV0PR18_9TELE